MCELCEQTGGSSKHKSLHGISVAVITVSDRVSTGKTTDLSGPAARELLAAEGADVAELVAVPDDKEEIKRAILSLTKNKGVALVVTTGGTGVGPRDVTPEAVMEVCDRIVPGFGELMRSEGLKHTPRAALSRSLAGLVGSSFVITFPGSEKGVRESYAAVREILAHAIHIARGGGH